MKQPLFLSDDELVQLTGRRMKSKQITWLRTQAVPFRVSATGHPVVTRVAIEGAAAPAERPRWVPKVLAGQLDRDWS
ncbi:DUF4224 domain-containing protein [Variovorax sp.]|uniref:DUF4224 domain-containing protein n=1 Tax=Variovorax sp. TaxID=1871043 RepID=UPI003BACFE03